MNNLFAATAPSLGGAQTFAVLGATTVTNTGLTTIMGDLGVSPGSAVTGFPPGVVTMGSIHAGDAAAAQAQTDAHTAYNFLAAEPCNTNLTGMNLGGLTLTPGVYCFASSAQLTGTLTLNAQGDPNAVFIFQIGTALTTASNSAVVIINGGIPCNVFFQVGSSATLGTGTQLLGSILANISITLTTNATVSGRVIALTGAVTLDTNNVSDCSVAGAPSGTLQVCKVAGSPGIAGTLFTFNVAGTPVVVPAGAGPGGTCSAPMVEVPGPIGITETIPPGIMVTAIATTPPGALVSSNLGTGTATVTVTAGALTVVTFTDALIPTTGSVQVCKVAGSGVITGTLFSFTVAGTPVNVAAGPPPGGTCSALLVETAGPVAVNETIPPGVVLTSVTTTPPGALVSSNLGAGTATVTVTVGATTIVTFTDALLALPVLDAFQIRYAANLNIGDSFVDITNTGTSSTTSFPTQNGNLCVNVYTFSPDEQLVSCCTCPVTPNGLASLSARNDLIGNTLTPGVPTSIVIKLLASDGGAAGAPVGCNAGTVGVGGLNLPVSGLSAWGTTLHALPVTPGTPAITYGETETPFTKATLSIAELQRIVTQCAFIQTNGSGFGICRACRLGGLGGSKQ